MARIPLFGMILSTETQALKRSSQGYFLCQNKNRLTLRIWANGIVMFGGGSGCGGRAFSPGRRSSFSYLETQWLEHTSIDWRVMFESGWLTARKCSQLNRLTICY